MKSNGSQSYAKHIRLIGRDGGCVKRMIQLWSTEGGTSAERRKLAENGHSRAPEFHHPVLKIVGNLPRPPWL
jgi:hypothetical protein